MGVEFFAKGIPWIVSVSVSFPEDSSLVESPDASSSSSSRSVELSKCERFGESFTELQPKLELINLNMRGKKRRGDLPAAVASRGGNVNAGRVPGQSDVFRSRSRFRSVPGKVFGGQRLVTVFPVGFLRRIRGDHAGYRHVAFDG